MGRPCANLVTDPWFHGANNNNVDLRRLLVQPSPVPNFALGSFWGLWGRAMHARRTRRGNATGPWQNIRMHVCAHGEDDLQILVYLSAQNLVHNILVSTLTLVGTMDGAGIPWPKTRRYYKLVYSTVLYSKCSTDLFLLIQHKSEKSSRRRILPNNLYLHWSANARIPTLRSRAYHPTTN
jgi:hypothetical protein